MKKHHGKELTPEMFAEIDAAARANGDYVVVYGDIMTTITQSTVDEGVEMLEEMSRQERRSVLASVNKAIQSAVGRALELNDTEKRNTADDIAIWFSELVRTGKQSNYLASSDQMATFRWKH